MTTFPLKLVLVDDGCGQLAPLTDLRAAFDVRTGALTLVERARLMGAEVIGLIVPEALAELTRERHPEVAVNGDLQIEGDVRVLNGRAVDVDLAQIGTLATGRTLVELGSGEFVAGVMPLDQARGLVGADCGAIEGEPTGGPCLLKRPWSVRTFRDWAIIADLAAIVTRRGMTAREGKVFVASTANVHPSAIFDDSGGVIVVDERATVRPGAIVIGPVYIGEHSTVLERATVRAFTSVGPWCKVNGEIGGTIFQGYSNKAHDGYIGDSYIGEWVNLGAGTTGSNLLNTYGEVISRMSVDGANERTGETFFGCVLGDHVKTAICTRIMTGAIVHTGTMFAASSALSGCVGAFSWITDAGRKNFRFEKFVEVARAAMGRRKIVPSAAYVERLRQIHGRD